MCFLFKFIQYLVCNHSFIHLIFEGSNNICQIRLEESYRKGRANRDNEEPIKAVLKELKQYYKLVNFYK